MVDRSPRADGRRRQIKRKRFKSKDEAYHAKTTLLAEIHGGTAVDPDQVSFGEYFRGFLEAHGSLKWASSTQENSQKRAQYALKLFGHVPLQKLKEETIEKGLLGLLLHGGFHGRPLSAKTVRAVAALMKQALEQAYRRGRIAKNPMLNVELPKMPSTEPKKPTEEQFERLLKRVAGTRYHAMVAFLGDSGCRRGEMLALTWDDLDFDTGEVVISKSLFRHSHAGMEIKCPKSGKTRKYILSETTLDLLREHRLRIEKEREQIGDAYENHGLIFCI